MKIVTLKELQLINCGCFENYTFEPNGENAVVQGMNGTGKTTIADAFCWLLTDKLMNGNTADLRPHDAEGKPLNDDDVLVTAYITVDEQEYIIEKQVRAGLKANETVYAVNGVQKRPKEYKEAIADIFGATQEQVGYCISAAHFLKNDTAARRETLFALAGLDDDSKIAADCTDFTELVAKLEVSNPDELMKSYRAALNGKGRQDKGLNGRLDDLASRLDEVQRAAEAIPKNNYLHNRCLDLSDLKKSVTVQVLEAERTLELIKDFKKHKAELASERVNSLFRVARFEFTEPSKSGDPKDICDLSYHGERYGKRLNSGARVLMDCDIVKGFQTAYGVQMPLLIDNAESLSPDTAVEMREGSGQCIAFVVDDTDLTVVTASDRREATNG